MKDHLFIASDGALHDTRDSDWSAKPLRRDYRRTFGTIETVAELKATIRNGGRAWPGGYPLFFITHDGAALSFETVRQNFLRAAGAMQGDYSDGWRVVACEVNWEDHGLTCDHSGEATRPPMVNRESALFRFHASRGNLERTRAWRHRRRNRPFRHRLLALIAFHLLGGASCDTLKAAKAAFFVA